MAIPYGVREDLRRRALVRRADHRFSGRIFVTCSGWNGIPWHGQFLDGAIVGGTLAGFALRLAQPAKEPRIRGSLPHSSDRTRSKDDNGWKTTFIDNLWRHGGSGSGFGAISIRARTCYSMDKWTLVRRGVFSEA